MNLSFAAAAILTSTASAGVRAASSLRGLKKQGPKHSRKLQEAENIKCGIAGGLNTFDGDVVVKGFDVEYCRAYAAAIFGDPDLAKPIKITFAERWEALLSGKVDVVMGSTHTMERDVFQGGVESGFTFSVPTFYDGLKFGGVPKYVECADNLDVMAGCSDLRICIAEGTSWVRVVSQLFPPENFKVVDDGVGHAQLASGDCNLVAGESPNVIKKAAEAAGYTGDYAISKGTFSKEPLATVTLQEDTLFSDVVNWVNMAITTAEEKGITMATAEKGDTPTDVKFAQVSDEFETRFTEAIAAVGNYGELYKRTAEADVPRAGLNRLNTGGSGLINSLPFGAVDVEGAPPTEMGKIAEISSRGSLVCGVIQQPGLDDINPETNEWEGFDVDFCRALSAALFAGDAYRVNFISLPASDRFVELENGNVDVLSRKTTATLSRDFLEPSTEVGFSFASPNFYDGMAFGGVPSFVACAENQNFSGDCSALKICVIDGTTTLARLRELIPEENIFVTAVKVFDDFVAGNCNVVTSDAGGIAEPLARAAGYTGEYKIGDGRYSKEPLALVTRENDKQWSDFVFWVVQGLFYAEEAGITQATAGDMPTTKLFGPELEKMFVWSVGAVGNFGELYDRTIESAVPRSGLNLVNSDNGPQHYPLPGV